MHFCKISECVGKNPDRERASSTISQYSFKVKFIKSDFDGTQVFSSVVNNTVFPLFCYCILYSLHPRSDRRRQKKKAYFPVGPDANVTLDSAGKTTRRRTLMLHTARRYVHRNALVQMQRCKLSRVRDVYRSIAYFDHTLNYFFCKSTFWSICFSSENSVFFLHNIYFFSSSSNWENTRKWTTHLLYS